jgi:hypothetical protein
MTSGIFTVMTVLSAAVVVTGCSKSNSVLLGRVEANLGTHPIIVTDCYRTSVPSTQMTKDPVDGTVVYRWAPCVDADVVIHHDLLMVNGKAYKRLSPGDTIIVDHVQVLVNTHVARGVGELP